MSVVLHVQVEGEAEREFWREQQAQAAARGCCWVPHSMTMALCEDGSLSVVEGEEAVEDCKVSLASARASGEPVCVVLRAGECSVRAGHGGGPREGRLDGGSGKPDRSHQSPSLLPHQEAGTVSLPTSAYLIAMPDSWTCCVSADSCQVPVVSLQ